MKEGRLQHVWHLQITYLGVHISCMSDALSAAGRWNSSNVHLYTFLEGSDVCA